MKKTLLLLGVTILMFSCKKNKPDVPTTESASSTSIITGSIGPVGIAAGISLVYDQNSRFIPLIVDPATGKFKLEDLSPGKYLLSIYPTGNNSYNNILGLNVEVIRGKVIDVGLLQLVSSNVSQPALSGTLLPAGFGTAVNATERASGRVYTITPDKSGYFWLPLADGEYTVSFGTKAPLQSPYEMRVSIAGKVASLGTINAKEGNSGSLTGKLSPAYTVNSISATNKQTGEISAGTINSLTGIFGFPGLIPGNYNIDLTVSAPYLAPATQQALVEFHKSTDIGTIVVPYDNDVKFLTYKVDGTTYQRYNSPCIFTGNNFNFSLSSGFFSGTSPRYQIWTNSTLTLSVGNITGVGQYALTGKDGANLTLTEATSSPYGSPTVTTNWGISSSAAVGKLQITGVDPNARTLKGTFSGMLIADKSGISNKTITEGSFYFNY